MEFQPHFQKGFALRARGAGWDDPENHMLVCHCRRVFDREIRAAIQGGASTVDEVGMACDAGMGCGGCQETIEELIDAERGCPHGMVRICAAVSIEQHESQFHLPVVVAAVG